MNWERLALSKNLKLITCFVPGIVTLAVWSVLHPNLLRALQELGFFGYKTKVLFLAGTAFTIGLPIQEAFMSFHMFVLVRLWRLTRSPFDSTPEIDKPTKSKPWENEVWRSLVKQVFFVGLHDEELLKQPELFWKTMWETINSFYLESWKVLEFRAHRLFALAFFSSTTVLLFASILIHSLRSWWFIPLETAWMVLLWKPPLDAYRLGQSEYHRDKTQLLHLVRIVVSKQAPTLEFR